MSNKAITLTGHYPSGCMQPSASSIKPRTLKKMITSKSFIHQCNNERKSCSTGTISYPEKLTQSRKVTKSDLSFKKNVPKHYVKSDLCKKCGDANEKKEEKKEINKLYSHDTIPWARTKIASKYQNEWTSSNHLFLGDKNQQTVQQYFKNKNFAPSSESVHLAQSKNKRKPSLGTIKEISEVPLSDINSSKDVLFQIDPESTAVNIECFDIDRRDKIKEINEFRQRNYFECHSAESRVKAKGNATSLGDHKCVYRFYLNERLFPVPLNSDHHNNIRCIECHLPIEETRHRSDLNCQDVNGTVQAKVKLNNEVQDMILMLPVKEPLIIKEKRKEIQSAVNREVLYFGIIKLTSSGDSIFNSTRPNNSLALKYQKGYKEFESNHGYRYESASDRDVIII